MPAPNLTQIKAATALIKNAYTDKDWNTTRKDEVYAEFCKALPLPAFQAETLKHAAWAQFLWWAANRGGSDKNFDSSNIIIHGTATVNGPTYRACYNQLSFLEYFTLQRLLLNFCDDVSLILSEKDKMTDWGVQNGLPEEYKAFAFPSGVYCRNVSHDAKRAINAAKAHALGRQAAPLSDMYQLPSAQYAGYGSSARLMIE